MINAVPICTGLRINSDGARLLTILLNSKGIVQ